LHGAQGRASGSKNYGRAGEPRRSKRHRLDSLRPVVYTGAMTKNATFALLLCLCFPAAGCGGSDSPSSSPDDGAGGGGASADGAIEDGATEGATPAPIDPRLVAPEDVAAPPADAIVTRSGLASKVLEPGTGTRHPRENERVRVDYSGWQTDGTLFDSSIRRGTPSEFALDEVIEGWTEGLQLMLVGERRRFWIPEELAYKGREGRPSGMLVFDVDLIAITGI
jgi:FKBP-type peptidyl-prolyl isomerase-like protein